MSFPRNAQYQSSFPLSEKQDSFAIDFEENRTIISTLKNYCSEYSILLSVLLQKGYLISNLNFQVKVFTRNMTEEYSSVAILSIPMEKYTFTT